MTLHNAHTQYKKRANYEIRTTDNIEKIIKNRPILRIMRKLYANAFGHSMEYTEKFKHFIISGFTLGIHWSIFTQYITMKITFVSI